MDFIRCPGCQAPMSKKSRSCRRCGMRLVADEGVTFGDIAQKIKVGFGWLSDGLFWLTSWVDKKPAMAKTDKPESLLTQRDIELALEAREKQKEPMKCALLGCLFGIIGIFFLGLLFVPLALLFTGAGLIGSVLRFRVDAFVVSLLGICLTVAAIVTSPSVLLLIGISATQ